MDKVRQLNEGEVVDFNRAKRTRELAARSPDEKYKTAQLRDKMKLNGTKGGLADEVNEVIDLALGSMMRGEELPADVQQRAANLALISHHLSAMEASNLIRSIFSLYNEKNPEKTFHWSSPDRRGAYMDDNPNLTKFRVWSREGRTKQPTVLFDSFSQFIDWTFETLFPHVPEAVTSDKLRKVVAELSSDDRADLIDRLQTFYDLDRDFDPETHRTGSSPILPTIEKFLKTMEYPRGSDEAANAYISLQMKPYHDGNNLTFNSRMTAPKTFSFETIEELENWVLQHKDNIKSWYARANNRSNANQAPLIRLITQRIVGYIRTILSGDFDQKKLEDDAWVTRDQIYSLDNIDLRNMFSSLLMDIRAPRMQKYLTDYHITWLPEKVKEILSKN